MTKKVNICFKFDLIKILKKFQSKCQRITIIESKYLLNIIMVQILFIGANLRSNQYFKIGHFTIHWKLGAVKPNFLTQDLIISEILLLKFDHSNYTAQILPFSLKLLSHV